MRRSLTLTAAILAVLVTALLMVGLPTRVDAASCDVVTIATVDQGILITAPGVAPPIVFDSKMGDYMALQSSGHEPYTGVTPSGSRGQPASVPDIYSGTYAVVEHGYPITGHGNGTNLRI